MRTRILGFTVALLLAHYSSASGQSRLDIAVDNAVRDYESGEYGKAMTTLSKVVQLKKNHAVALYYLARIHLEGPDKNMDEARKHYQRAKKHGLTFAGKITELAALEVKDEKGGRPSAREVAAQAAEEAEEKDGPTSAEEPDDSTPTDGPAVTPSSTPPSTPAAPPIVVLPIKRRVEVSSDAEEMLPNIRNTELGRILEKERRLGEDGLTLKEIRVLHTSKSGSQMCLRLIDRGDLEGAERYANDVIFVAPDFWKGFYLKTRIYLEREDMVAATNSWRECLQRGYQETDGWPDLTGDIIAEPVALLEHYLADAPPRMKEGDWVGADESVMKIQDIVGLDNQSPQVRPLLIEAKYLRGRIAYELQDYGGAIDDLQPLVDRGLGPPDTVVLLAKAAAAKDSVDAIPLDRRPIKVEPIRISSRAGEYGTVRFELNRSYLSISTTTLGVVEKDAQTERIAGEETAFQTEGGKAYRLQLDLRAQLRQLALHGIGVAVLLGVLVAN